MCEWRLPEDNLQFSTPRVMRSFLSSQVPWPVPRKVLGDTPFIALVPPGLSYCAAGGGGFYLGSMVAIVLFSKIMRTREKRWYKHGISKIREVTWVWRMLSEAMKLHSMVLHHVEIGKYAPYILHIFRALVGVLSWCNPLMLTLRCVLEAEINQQSHSHRTSSFVLLANMFRRLLMFTFIVVKDTKPSTMWIRICEQICPDVQMDSLRAFVLFVVGKKRKVQDDWNLKWQDMVCKCSTTTSSFGLHLKEVCVCVCSQKTQPVVGS